MSSSFAICMRMHAPLPFSRIIRHFAAKTSMTSNSENATNIEAWTKEQLDIASKVCTADENNWSQFFAPNCFNSSRDLFIAGADISFPTTPSKSPVGTIAVVKLLRDSSCRLVYSRSRPVEILHPYVPQFLGFREAPVIFQMLSELPRKVRESIDCLLLDGNGVLHPRRAGLACQVGTAENIPCVGVSKNLLCLDGLTDKHTRERVSASSNGILELVGDSGALWGTAVLTGNALSKPIFVSVGHRVSLITATRLVCCLCEFRVPAPIRFADMHSRALIRGENVQVYNDDEFPNQ